MCHVFAAARPQVAASGAVRSESDFLNLAVVSFSNLVERRMYSHRVCYVCLFVVSRVLPAPYFCASFTAGFLLVWGRLLSIVDAA